MKALKKTIVVLAATLLAIGIGTTASAFHAGGVADCSGCHSMHSPKVGGTFLLIGGDQSSTCLSCHMHAGDTAPSSYHIMTADADMPAGVAPLQRTPGGDFGWLKKTYTWPTRDGLGTETETGDSHGHNIIATDFGYVTDAVNATAPGGTFPSNKLACTSCHDPHGKYRRLSTGTIAATGAPIKASGSGTGATNEPTADEAVGVYRLLAGNGYTPKSLGSAIGFTGVPAAKAPSYNRTEATTQTRVAYGDTQVTVANGGATWGNWCGTCHGDMHNADGSKYVHKSDTGLGSVISGNYNSYVKSGVMTGVAASAFTSLVPFAESATTAIDYPALATHAKADDTYLQGPGTTDKVMCLTCHRAHASGWEYAARWNLEYEFLTQAGAYPTSGYASRGRSQAEVAASYYDRLPTVFATYQRSLCNKCHAKD